MVWLHWLIKCIFLWSVELSTFVLYMATSVQMNPCCLIMSKLCCVFVLTWMIVCITLLLRYMVVLWLAAKSRSPWKLQAPNLHLVMQLWTSSNRLRYVNSAKTLSSVNYINYWSRFWRLKRCSWYQYHYQFLPELLIQLKCFPSLYL